VPLVGVLPMRLLLLLLTSTLMGAPAAAQDGKPSSATTSAEDAATQGLPVSLDRIREGLATGSPKLSLSALEKPPDFKVEVQERRALEEILSALDFKTGPVPAGGLYAYEQQRQLFSPVDRPLAQPYAAFSAGEAITIAIENLVGRYLAGRLAETASNAERAKAEAAARRDVAGAIEKYCAADAERAKRLSICTR
jgi:hypothetical protein